MPVPNAGQPADVLIVGGGIIGLSLAYELSSRGQLVTLVERDACGRAASWAGVGILPPVATRAVEEPLEQLRSLSHRLLAEWSQQLESETGMDTGWQACGGIYLATTPGEAATLAANRLWWDEHGIEASPWTAAQLAAQEPSLAALAQSDRLRAIWWLPQECQVRTPHYVQALIAACRSRGVKIVEHCPVTKIDCRADGSIAVTTTCGPMHAEKLCLTAGPWTRPLLEPLGVVTGILPVRGQIVLFRPQQPLLKSVVNEGHRYLVPRADARVLVGSNEEEVGFACQTTPDVLAELHQWACGMLPQLADAEVEKSWAGLRPGSFDSYPYIGSLPDHPGVFVAAGHYRAGIHLSCGTAVVLADLMTEGHSSIDLAPFRPGRG
jgi:glycine oxidase